MGDHPATWRCRRSPGASDGQRCHTVVEIRLTSRTIGSLRLGPAQVSDGSQRQGRQARRARLLLLSSPKRRSALQGGPRSCLKAPARCAPSPAWSRGSPWSDGDARHSAHAPCDTARPLRHDRSLRQTRQLARQRRRRSPTWDRGPVRPRKGTRMPDTIPVPSAARRPGSPRGSGSAQPTARSSTSRPAA